MILYLEVSQYVLAVALIAHAIRSRSGEFALLFWFGGFLLGFFREMSVLRLLHLYTFGDYYLTLFGVPLVSGLLWSNFIYLAIWLVRSFTMIDVTQGRVSSRGFLTAGAIVVLLGCLYDYLAVGYGLIKWAPGWSPLPGGIPPERVLEYGMTSILYMMAFRGVRAGPWNTTRRMVGLILLNPLLIVLGLGFMLLFRFIFSLLFG